MCVFKNHAFIYFLRPPLWSGTVTIYYEKQYIRQKYLRKMLFYAGKLAPSLFLFFCFSSFRAASDLATISCLASCWWKDFTVIAILHKHKILFYVFVSYSENFRLIWGHFLTFLYLRKNYFSVGVYVRLPVGEL